MVKKKDLYESTIRDMVALEFPMDVRVSPDGMKVAFKVRTTNWKDDRYESHCYLYDDSTSVTRQVTRYGDIQQLEWLDEQTLGLLKANGGTPQVCLFEGGTGEGWEVTNHKTGVEWFHPFAGGIVFMARQPDKDEKKTRADKYGKYDHFEQEQSSSALYFVGLGELAEYQKQTRAATEDEGNKLVAPVVELSKLFTEPIAIKEIIVSPAGDALYLNCWKAEDLVYARETSVFQIRLDANAALATYLKKERAKQTQKKPSSAAAKEKKEDWSFLGKLSELQLPKGARVSAVSPDGTQLLIGYQERDRMFYTREDLWVVRTRAVERAKNPARCLAAMTNLTSAFDREMMGVYWTEAGIFSDYVDGTHICIARLDEHGKVMPLELGVFEFIGFFGFGRFHVSRSGHLAVSGTNAKSFAEVYFATPTKKNKKWKLRQLTHFGRQIEGWDLGTVESITWQSKDGSRIEGVLRKPSDFDPRKKYPLVLVVHGGPTWFSSEYLLAGEDLWYYPSLQFNLKEMLVLKPNYRGSLGRGQAFLELNVNNLGVGDLWDLESAVDHLVDLGWVDPDKVGCMGWSQGGYISAFVGLHSEKFKAVSVGAGISDWYTYHISNDIPDFTRDYLSGSPFRDRVLYEKTAPISNISKAKTPMLIQHGSEDRRVPLSNAMELYRGLKEMNVPVELFIYPGMAHLITKPRENHAVMYQNLNWFSHYLLGEDLKLE